MDLMNLLMRKPFTMLTRVSRELFSRRMRNSSLSLDMTEPSHTVFILCKCREPSPYLPQTSKESSNSSEQRVFMSIKKVYKTRYTTITVYRLSKRQNKSRLKIRMLTVICNLLFVNNREVSKLEGFFSALPWISVFFSFFMLCMTSRPVLLRWQTVR